MIPRPRLGASLVVTPNKCNIRSRLYLIKQGYMSAVNLGHYRSRNKHATDLNRKLDKRMKSIHLLKIPTISLRYHYAIPTISLRRSRVDPALPPTISLRYPYDIPRRSRVAPYALPTRSLRAPYELPTRSLGNPSVDPA